MISISIGKDPTHLVCDECPDAMLCQFGSSTKSSKLHADAERNMYISKCARVNSVLKLLKLPQNRYQQKKKNS